MSVDLLAEALDALERVGCQFKFCDGPTLEPVAMCTCYRCEIVARLRVALGRPARIDSDLTSLEAIQLREDDYLAGAVPGYQRRFRVAADGAPPEDGDRG